MKRLISFLMRIFIVPTLLLLFSIQVAVAEEQIVLKQALYSGPIGSIFSGGRSAVYSDPVLHDLSRGVLTAPKEGDVAGTSFRGGDVVWTNVELDAEGVFQMERAFGGYIYLRYEASEPGTYLLRCNGNAEILVNGVLRAGDYYANGWVIHPVALKQGTNEFWYKMGRGRNKSFTLERSSKPVFLTSVDATLPDLLTTEIDEKWGAVRD